MSVEDFEHARVLRERDEALAALAAVRAEVAECRTEIECANVEERRLLDDNMSLRRELDTLRAGFSGSMDAFRRHVANVERERDAVRTERDAAREHMDKQVKVASDLLADLEAVRAERDGLRGVLEDAMQDCRDRNGELAIAPQWYIDARRALSTAGGAQDGNRPAESPGIGSDLATVDATPRAHEFADCITADGDTPCRECAEYAIDAVGATPPKEPT